MTTQARVLLARNRGLMGELRVYQARDALELDSLGHGELRRRRIFYDDVVFVAYHRRLSAPFLASSGLIVVLLGALAGFLARDGVPPRASLLLFALTELSLLFGITLHLLLGSHVVTVQGRRTWARIVFGARGRRARAAFAGICGLAREAQSRPSQEPSNRGGRGD